MRLEGKVAVVTGAASGIGRQVATRFAAEGATIAALDLALAQAEEAIAEIDGSGHRAFELDVADAPAVVRVFGEVDAAFGRVDVLVNCAGVSSTRGDGMQEAMEAREPFQLHMSDDGFARVMAINVNGTFSCSREAARIMHREGRGGSIVNLSSVAGLHGDGSPPHYAASKSAVLGLTRSFARGLGGSQIRVNALCPGLIDTPMTEALPEFALKAIVASTPLGRKGQPQEIADAALFLASDESAFVTGQWLSPNGGQLMC